MENVDCVNDVTNLSKLAMEGVSVVELRKKPRETQTNLNQLIGWYQSINM